MKVNPKNIIQEGLLLEQAAYNPVTSGDVTNGGWDPCTNAQFMLGTGQGSYVGCDWAGQIDISTYANWTLPVAWGGACNNTSSEVCLAYDPAHGFLTADGNSTLASTNCSSGCVWGTTFNTTSGMYFEGWECNSGNGICETVDTGSGTYDTEVICDQNCSGVVTQTIGCCVPYTNTLFLSTHVGCEDNNNPGDPAFADCSNTDCCDFVMGCLDNRQYPNGNFMVPGTDNAWSIANNVGTPGGVSATYDTFLRLDYDTSTTPYGITAYPFGFPDPSNLLLGSFNGCNYGVMGGPVSGDWGCLDPTATNYCPSCEADCGTIAIQVPTLKTNDPYFTFVGANGQTNCCTYNEGCMDGGPGNDGSGAYVPAWRPIGFQGAACTYDQNATVHIEADCLYGSCQGCMNPIASNYNASATSDNGSCLYAAGCMDPTANNTSLNAVADCDGNLVIDGGEYAAQSGNAYSQWPSYSLGGVDQWTNTYIASGNMVTTGCTDPNNDCTYTIFGCTDVNAFNYNGTANSDDGTCAYEACGNAGATNYFVLGGGAGTQYTPPGNYVGVDCDGTTPFTDISCCQMPFYGCTDPTASNYNSTSGAQPCTAQNGGPCIEDASGTMQTGSNCCCCLVTGCADDTTTWDAACNHPTTGADNYDQWACDPDPSSCIYYGCTDPLAYNYCPTANTDDGSCLIEGCNDPAGNNYNVSYGGCVGDGGLIGTNNDGSVPNGCCSYTYGCTDPVATNYSANVDYVCNSTSNNFGFTTVYGNSGPNCVSCVPVYITPTDSGASDNDCCSYIPGCTDSAAFNYDSLATLDDGSCTYTFGCKEQNDGDSTNSGPHNHTNYTPAAIYPCNNTMGNNNSFGVATNVYGTLPTDGLYDNTDDNDCCVIEGCMDQMAVNFIPWATSSSAGCIQPSYGCAVQFNSNGDAYDNYIPGSAGCYDNQVNAGPWYWTYDINGTSTNGPGIPDPTDESCCIYTAPNIISFGCVGQYDLGDDLNVPPAGGWGACEQITAPLTNAIQAAELSYSLVNAPTAPLTYEGTYLFQGPDTDILAISAACNASCRPSGQHDCEDLPVIGCSFCQPDSLGDLCSTAIDDMQAIFWGWDTGASSQGAYLAFNTLDDCNNSPDCGLERHGCMDSNYCEFWTQSIEISPNVYENGTGGNITYPAGVPGFMTIGLLAVDSAQGGCITPITAGCTEISAGDYDPNAIDQCPNPYVDSSGISSPDPAHLAANASGPARYGNMGMIDIIGNSSNLYLDWMNPGALGSVNNCANCATSPTWMSAADWSCSFVCEDSFGMVGDPYEVMFNGGACCVCECPAPCAQNCTLESDYNNYNNSWIYHNPDDLTTWTGCAGCDASTWCSGTPGQECIDDGSDNFMGEFDSKRASFGWPAAGTSSSTNSPFVPACNYDANAVPQTPDDTYCEYECKGCSDPAALNGPNNTVVPPTATGCDNGDPTDNPTTVQSPDNYNAPLVAEDDCCCYIEGCTDDTIGDNPGWNSASSQFDLCANGTVCGTSGCCGAGNGYVMVNYNPEACMDDQSCTSDRGFNCEEGGGSTGLCEPHITAGLGTFTDLQACIQSGCGSDRFICAPGQGIGGNNNTGVVSIGPGETGTYLSADSETTGIETGGGIDKEFDRKTTSQTKLTEQMAGGIEMAGGQIQADMEKEELAVYDPSKLLDCCIPDPQGPYLTVEECAQQSVCFDCATFDDPRWHCEAGAGTYDPVLNQSGSLCTLTTLGDCITNSWTCWTNQMACVRSGCEHDHETWTCPWRPDEEEDVGISLGEQNWYGTSFRKPLNELTLVNDIYPDCVQGGYMGWNSEQECLDNSPCTTNTGTTCFIGSCKIKMFDGTEKRIDQVIEGDTVLNDKGTSSTVVGVQRHEDFHDKLYGFNGEDPFVTAEHPLLAEGDTWKSIDPNWFPKEFGHDIERFQLEVGDKLIMGEDKESKVITSIDEHKLEEAVYNLQLDVVHTYYVNGYVAHNAFFRNERPLSEREIGGGEVPWIDPVHWPIDECWCGDQPPTYSSLCCHKGPFGPGSPNPPSPPSTPAGYKCCNSNSQTPVGGWNNILCPSGPTGGYLSCCIPSTQTCPSGSIEDPMCKVQSPGGPNYPPNGTWYYGTQSQCNSCCSGPIVFPSVNPSAAPPQPGGGGGDGDVKGEIKTQPKPEHAKKMTQWEKAVSDNAGERVMFNTYGVDANPLFNSPSKTEYGYNIISGDITRIDDDTKTIIGNFIDTEDEPVKVQPTEKPVGEPTDQPIVEPVKTPDTPETKELREQVLRMKKLMGL